MNVKTRRLELGLSQKAIASAAGINIRQLQKIEAGEIDIGNVTLRNAIALADALHTDVRELLADAPPF